MNRINQLKMSAQRNWVEFPAVEDKWHLCRPPWQVTQNDIFNSVHISVELKQLKQLKQLKRKRLPSNGNGGSN